MFCLKLVFLLFLVMYFFFFSNEFDMDFGSIDMILVENDDVEQDSIFQSLILRWVNFYFLDVCLEEDEFEEFEEFGDVNMGVDVVVGVVLDDVYCLFVDWMESLGIGKVVMFLYLGSFVVIVGGDESGYFSLMEDDVI